jgi:2-keto-3-deoxy-L-rhamnonate aldolase RhmA
MSNLAKQRLMQNESLFVGSLSIASPAVVDIFGFAGIDCVELDSEHSALSNERMEWLLVACHAAGMAPIWRGRFDEARVMIALDVGFTNFIFPHIRSAADVQRVLSACRYRPRGRRGVGPGRPIRFGLDHPVEYIKRDDEDLLIGFMIEDPEAVDNIEEIVSVPGVQFVQIGFWDLSVGYEMPMQERHPRLVAAAERVLAACLPRGVVVGIPPVSPEDLCNWHVKGARFFEIASDTVLLARAAENCVREYSHGIQALKAKAAESV